jgi:hypothetical protein
LDQAPYDHGRHRLACRLELDLDSHRLLDACPTNIFDGLWRWCAA